MVEGQSIQGHMNGEMDVLHHPWHPHCPWGIHHTPSPFPWVSQPHALVPTPTQNCAAPQGFVITPAKLSLVGIKSTPSVPPIGSCSWPWWLGAREQEENGYSPMDMLLISSGT